MIIKDDSNEIDVPLQENNDFSNRCLETTVMSANRVDSLERRIQYADKMEKHVYKERAFHIMIACGIVYLVLVIFDTVVINAFSWEKSPLLEGFVELIKFVISILIGFVFSENRKKKD